MKKLSIKWNVGTDENGEPILKTQSLNVQDSVDAQKALSIAQTIEKYTNYSLYSAQLVTYTPVL
ncbi:MAG TPA: hypothetical protein DER56_04060 [Thermosipho africanus]|nr:hypothetical protein [Thermosipho africanus]